MLSELKSLSGPQAAALQKAGWTVETLATAKQSELVRVRGVGPATAKKAIAEAGEALNAQGLVEAQRLAREKYYQVAPGEKILADWESQGLQAQEIALASAQALAVHQDVSLEVALKVISAAQDAVNQRMLYESRTIAPLMETRPEVSPAFPVDWLSGETEPPPMSARIRGNFERAKEEYERVMNG